MEIETVKAPEKADRRRTLARAKVMLAASLETVDGSVAVKIRNISEFGALLEGYPLPFRDQKVTLKRLSLKATARVAWSRGLSCGIEFDFPVVPARWLDSAMRSFSANTAGQARVDAIQAAIRRGQPAEPDALSARSSAERLGEADLDRRIAEELEHVQRIVETIADELAVEPLVVHRHAAALQRFDLVSQVLGHLAKIINADDRTAAVESVGMSDLRGRLTRTRI